MKTTITLNRYGRALLAILLVALCLSGCAHNQPNLTPTQNAQINLYTALSEIASANYAVQSTAIILNGEKLVSDDVTRSIVGYCSQVTVAGRAALQVLDSSQPATAKAQAILGLIGKLDLPPPVKTFAASSSTNAAVTAAIRNIIALEHLIVSLKTAQPSNVSTAKVVQ